MADDPHAATIHPSAYAWKPVRVRGKVVGYVGHTWEVECGVDGCLDAFVVLAADVTKGRVTATLRAHYREKHDD